MQDLQDLFEEIKQAGRLDSEGVFTSCDEGALDRLSRCLLPDPEMYHLKCIQALVAAGAESINVRQKTAWVTVEGGPVGPPPEVSPRDWIAQAWQSQVPGIRYLTCALVGAWGLFEEIRVHWGTLNWCLRPGESVLPEWLPDRGGGQARFDFKRKHWTLFGKRTLHAGRAFACPVPIHSPWSWTRGIWQIWPYNETSEVEARIPGLLGAVALACPDGRLLVPDSMGNFPVFLEPERPAVPLLSTLEKHDGMEANWFRCQRIYLLTDSEEMGRILPVEAGIALDPVLCDLGVSGLRCVVSTEQEGLSTDLSQFQVRDDQALATLQAALRQEAPELVARTCEHLKSWKPGLRFTNPNAAGIGGFVAGGALGFGLIAVTGMAAPFHFLAIPGALLGIYASSHYWRRTALRSLRVKLDQAAGGQKSERGGATNAR